MSRRKTDKTKPQQDDARDLTIDWIPITPEMSLRRGMRVRYGTNLGVLDEITDEGASLRVEFPTECEWLARSALLVRADDVRVLDRQERVKQALAEVHAGRTHPVMVIEDDKVSVLQGLPDDPSGRVAETIYTQVFAATWVKRQDLSVERRLAAARAEASTASRLARTAHAEDSTAEET